MKYEWSLDELYTSIESKEFKDDLNKLDVYIKDIIEFSKDINEIQDKVKLIEDYISKYIKYEEQFSKLSIFINLKLSVNTKDLEALKYSDILESKSNEIVKATTNIEKNISSIEDLKDIINKSTFLTEHKFIIEEIKEKSKYRLSDKEENIIANMKKTGSNAWSKLTDKLVSSLMVNMDNKEYPLTVILNKAYDKDKEVRKKAYMAELESYKKIDESMASALNGIKGEVITTSKLRGYNSPLEMTLLDSRMERETLDSMMKAIKKSLPVFREYLKCKAKLLGYKNGLPFYELYAPVVDDNLKYSYEEAGDFIIKNFSTFSNNLGNYAKKAIDNKWIDVMPKEGKVGGAFCENINVIGESRILLNFGGSFSDVITMAHELGHGFHGECLKGQSILNCDYPMPIAETASTFCETIVKNAAIKMMNKEDSLAILENDISDCTQIIVDIYSRFIFEDNLFRKRENSSLSVDEIKELMIEAQKEAYGDGLDQEFLHPYMWLWKPHYYDAEYNYYNFPYAFGLLFSKGLYVEYLKRGDSFINEYEKLLSVTGKNKIEDIAKVINIDIKNECFWENSLKLIENDIRKFIEIVNFKRNLL